MAATQKKQMYLLATADGVAPEVRTCKIAASQGVFMPGAPCYISTSGTAKLSDTSDGTGDTHHGFIVGLTNKSGTWPVTSALAANTEIEVLMIDPDDYYAVYVENNDSDSAITQSNVGNNYGLRVSTTSGVIGYTTLDINNSNGVVQVVDVMQNRDSKFADATSPGVAIVKFLASVVEATRS